MLLPVVIVFFPWLQNLHTYGFHDWDVETSHRYLAVLSLKRYHELPAWNPYACGGFPAWGYIESGTIVVSPWLPAYLTLSMPVALRVEVIGMGLIGVFGAYVAASRFTNSLSARVLVSVLWAVNGRFALQAAAGHTWHLAYAFLPLALAFYEDARKPDARARSFVLTAGVFAMLVYAGGIYPLPHTVLLLGLYAVGVAWAEKSLRPLTTLAGTGLLGVVLSAPKLLPMIDVFLKYPRLIDSKETLNLGTFLAILTAPEQFIGSRPAKVSAYGWHEWGMYIGFAGLLLVLVGLFLRAKSPKKVLLPVGLVFLILGFGAFHEDAPWAWVHAHVPMFQSQHVPSRFLYVSLFVLALVAAMGWDRIVDRLSRKHPWLDAALLAALGLLALDISKVAQQPMTQSMWMEAPAIQEQSEFSFAKEPPYQYKKRDWAGPLYLAMLGNTGVLNCYGTPPFERKGALAQNDPALN